MKPGVNKNQMNKWGILMIGFAEQNKSVATGMSFSQHNQYHNGVLDHR